MKYLLAVMLLVGGCADQSVYESLNSHPPRHAVDHKGVVPASRVPAPMVLEGRL